MTRASLALKHARSCYGHLAGEAGVALRQRLEAEGLIQQQGNAYRLTGTGRKWAEAQHLDTDDRHAERHARCCLDWTERQPHIGGRLGASILARLLETKGVQRGEGRVLLCAEGSGFDAVLAALDLRSQAGLASCNPKRMAGNLSVATLEQGASSHE